VTADALSLALSKKGLSLIGLIFIYSSLLRILLHIWSFEQYCRLTEIY